MLICVRGALIKHDDFEILAEIFMKVSMPTPTGILNLVQSRGSVIRADIGAGRPEASYACCPFSRLESLDLTAHLAERGSVDPDKSECMSTSVRVALLKSFLMKMSCSNNTFGRQATLPTTELRAALYGAIITVNQS